MDCSNLRRVLCFRSENKNIAGGFLRYKIIEKVDFFLREEVVAMINYGQGRESWRGKLARDFLAALSSIFFHCLLNLYLVQDFVMSFYSIPSLLTKPSS